MSDRMQELEEQKEELVIQELKGNIENNLYQQDLYKRANEQELLRRAIEVCSSALGRVPAECSDHLTNVVKVASDKLKNLVEKM